MPESVTAATRYPLALQLHNTLIYNNKLWLVVLTFVQICSF